MVTVTEGDHPQGASAVRSDPPNCAWVVIGPRCGWHIPVNQFWLHQRFGLHLDMDG